MISLKKIDRYKKRFSESNFKKKTMPKILSVLFAIIFWLYVMDQVNPEMVRTIPNMPVEVLNEELIQSGGFVVLDKKVPSVTVKIKGRRKAVMNITEDDIILSTDVKDFHKGNNYFPIGKKIFADNVTIEDLSENRVQMNIDRLTETTKTITLKTVGKLPEGETLGNVKLSPDRVVVRGPESVVKLVAGIWGEVDLSTVQNNAVANITLKSIDQNGREVTGITLSSSTVSATLGVMRENNAEIQADLVGSLPTGFKITNISIEPKTVSLKGQAGNAQEVKSIKTKPINLSTFNTNQSISIGLVTPAIAGLQGIPETVKVELTIEKIEEKELVFSASEIKWFNLPSGMNIQLPDEERTLTVKVKAVSSVLEKLDQTAFQLEADAGELKEGPMKIKVTVSTNLDTESLIVVPSTIDVEGIKN